MVCRWQGGDQRRSGLAQRAEGKPRLPGTLRRPGKHSAAEREHGMTILRYRGKLAKTEMEEQVEEDTGNIDAEI